MPVVKLSCYCATLRQAARAISALYDEKLQGTGIRATQFTILGALERQPNARNVDLVEWLAIDQTTLTRNLELLRRRGLVETTQRPSKREKGWRLTKAGQSILDAAQPAWEAAQGQVRKRFGVEKTRDMHADVHALAANLAT